MRQLYPSELQAIIQELQRQKLLEKYADQKSKWAFLAAVISNGVAILARAFSGKKKKLKTIEPDDFLNKDFKKIILKILGEEKSNKKKDKNFDKHIQDAKHKGLSGPW
jgi:phosphoenolpyruvate synthase/pyruvate phosphate dikinase